MKTRTMGAWAFACFLLAACGGPTAGAGGPKMADGPGSGAPAPDGTHAGAPDAVPPGSLAEQAQWTKLNEAMEANVKTLNAACGTSIKGSYDVASYKGKFKDGESYGVSAYSRSSCESLLSSVAHLCTSSEPGKTRVKAKIQGIQCKLGTSGQKPAVSLTGSTLSGQFDPEAGGAVMGSATTEWLQKSL